ncbi:MAG: rod shape-determining protein RodA [Bacteroidia bacterium]
MRNSKGTLFSNIDPILFALYLLLMFFGLATIYSSSYSEEFPNLFSFEKEYGRQVVFIGVSLLLGIGILNLDKDFFFRYSFIFYLIVLLLLIGVLFTPPINGARSWFSIGPFSLQPSEFAKYATSLTLAQYMSLPTTRLKSISTRFLILLMIAIPAGLIILQPDAGTLLVFISFIFVFYREGLSGGILLFGVYAIGLAVITLFYQNTFINIPFSENKLEANYFIIIVLTFFALIFWWMIQFLVRPRYRARQYVNLIAAYAVSVTIILSASWVFQNIFEDRHRDRIEILFGKKIDRQGAGYNIYQAMSAVGSGGFIGKGYRDGTLSNDQFKHVPEQSTDFIFCSLSEEWGFVGSLLMILLFMGLIVKIILIAERQRSQFTRIFAYCAAGIFFFHFMINIGMVIGLAPVIGIPLPFFSYGGSSIISFSLIIFTLLKLDAERLDIFR